MYIEINLINPYNNNKSMRRTDEETLITQAIEVLNTPHYLYILELTKIMNVRSTIFYYSR